MQEQSFKGWIVLVPGTMEPYAEAHKETGRKYIVFCGETAKDDAKQLASQYPEGQRFVKEVVILEKRKLFKR